MNSSMTVGKKITLLGVFLLSLTLILGVSSLTGLNSLVKTAHSLSDDSLAGVSACSKVESYLMEMRGDMWRRIASTDDKDAAAMDKEIQRLREAIQADLSEVEKAIFADQERQIFAKIKPGLDGYYRAWDDAAVLSRAGDHGGAYKKFLEEGLPMFTPLKEAVRGETEYNRRTGDQYSAAAVSVGSRTTWLTWVVLVISMLAGSGGMFWMVRSINSVLTRCATELSEGSDQITSASSQVASSSQIAGAGSFRTGCIARRDLGVHRRNHFHDAQERREFEVGGRSDDSRWIARSKKATRRWIRW